MTNWESPVQKAIDRLQRPSNVFPFHQTATIVDHLASKKVALRTDVLALASQIHECNDGGVDFVRTILASVTTAAHGSGNVPDPGGWYFSATVEGIEVYVLDRGFSAAWRKARSKMKPA